MQKKKTIALLIFILLIGVIGGTAYFMLNKDDNSKKININVTRTEDDLILIKGGTFTMGSPETENWRSEDEVQHEVTVNDFYINEFEVTQEEYESIMEDNPSTFKGDNLPVENITWYQAIEYCNKLSEKTGFTPAYTIDGSNVSWDRSANGYRLPTEAEWEYAARAGTTTPFNTENSISSEESNYYGRYPYEIEENYFSQNKLDTKPGEYREKTIEVGSFNPNKWGLYDMHGNVGEWVYDYYGDYDLENKDNPTGPPTGSLRVSRGGGWNDFAKHLRSAYRASSVPSQGKYNIGFRIVRNATNNENDVINNSNESNTSGSKRHKSLIVYFSWGGNTKGVAEEIQSQTGFDIFEIELVKPYSSDYNTVLKQAGHDQNIGARPEIKGKVDNINQYDTIIIGYPNWWASIPMPIASFLEEYDLSGKTIYPVCSHGGGRFGQSLTAIAKLAPKSTIGEGLSIHNSGGSSLSKDVKEWLESNKIR